MNKLLIFFILALVTAQLQAQTTFDKGYYINNNGKKIKGLIRNSDWKNNPDKIFFKLEDTAPVNTLPIDSLQEFGIGETSKYIRRTVSLDISSDNVSNLSYVRKPLFRETLLLLNVLVEGKASLFSYENGDIKRFFYQIGNDTIYPLVHKRFFSKKIDSHKEKGNTISTNNRFRQQLSNDLTCSSSTAYEDISYKQNTLSNAFISYNKSCGNLAKVYQKKKSIGDIHFTIRPRINFATLKNKTPLLNNFQVNNLSAIGIGTELEYVLPFNNDKWSIFIEPTYQHYKKTEPVKSNYVLGGVVLFKVDYQSVEIPVGVRHYFYLSNSSKLFVNASVNFDILFNSSFQSTREDGSLITQYPLKSHPSMAAGIGYKLHEKFSMEARYITRRQLMYSLNSSSYFSALSVIFGYSIF